MHAAREYGIADALNHTGVQTLADTAYKATGDPGAAAASPSRPGHRPLPAAVPARRRSIPPTPASVSR
jgi:hypothetical protein